MSQECEISFFFKATLSTYLLNTAMCKALKQSLSYQSLVCVNPTMTSCGLTLYIGIPHYQRIDDNLDWNTI